VAHRITAADRRLLPAFKRHPFGPHSPALQRLLAVLRAGPAAGRHVLITRKPNAEWGLGRLTGRRGEAIEVIPGPTFTDRGTAEWAVLKLRWQALTGEELPD
jgi:hypothetical protein